MQFKKHSEFEGRHAYLSPSKPSWVRYDDEKLITSFEKHMDSVLGTRLHALADELIKLGIKLPDNTKTLNMYVNDCIANRMKTEVLLFVSAEAFGTADAIDFDPEIKLLRIFDLKNGTSPTTEEQLEIYAAYFCIEYGINPLEIGYDLRIYKDDNVYEYVTDPEYILELMDVTRNAVRILQRVKEV